MKQMAVPGDNVSSDGKSGIAPQSSGTAAKGSIKLSREELTKLAFRVPELAALLVAIWLFLGHMETVSASLSMSIDRNTEAIQGLNNYLRDGRNGR